MDNKKQEELNILQFITGLPMRFCKRIISIETKEDTIVVRAVVKIDTKAWRMAHASTTN